MKQFQKLNHFQDDASFSFIVGLAIKGTLDVLLNLLLDLLTHPALLPALQQLDIQRIRHPQSVLDVTVPHLAAHLSRNVLSNQRGRFLFQLQLLTLPTAQLLQHTRPLLY